MYNQYLQVQAVGVNKVISTSIQLPANVPIMEFQGDIFTEKNLPLDCSIFLQIGPDRFLAPTGTVVGVDFINHSCDPNCTIHVVGNRAILYSLYVIPSGSQLTFDYSTTSTDTLEKWQMKCSCGSPKCRQIISGHQYLSAEQQEEYNKKGLFPLFITSPNLFNKKW